MIAFNYCDYASIGVLFIYFAPAPSSPASSSTTLMPPSPPISSSIQKRQSIRKKQTSVEDYEVVSGEKEKA
jgi:hypothetical protein